MAGKGFARLSGEQVEAGTGFVREGVIGAGKHVVADAVQMAAELEPRSGRGNVVGGALAPFALSKTGRS